MSHSLWVRHLGWAEPGTSASLVCGHIAAMVSWQVTEAGRLVLGPPGDSATHHCPCHWGWAHRGPQSSLVSLGAQQTLQGGARGVLTAFGGSTPCLLLLCLPSAYHVAHAAALQPHPWKGVGPHSMLQAPEHQDPSLCYSEDYGSIEGRGFSF